jgi:hypothetical protein
MACNTELCAEVMHRKPFEYRLRAQSSLNVVTGCLEWNGWRNKKGYGRIVYHGKKHLVHRAAYEHFKGAIPEGLMVCHKCDNTSCWNPGHLFTGTGVDNAQDAVRKGRYKPNLSGRKNAPSRKVSAQSAEMAKRMYRRGSTFAAIGRVLGVSGHTIRKIIDGVVTGHK